MKHPITLKSNFPTLNGSSSNFKYEIILHLPDVLGSTTQYLKEIGPSKTELSSQHKGFDRLPKIPVNIQRFPEAPSKITLKEQVFTGFEKIGFTEFTVVSRFQVPMLLLHCISSIQAIMEKQTNKYLYF
jgi:hypothetical protein